MKYYEIKDRSCKRRCGINKIAIEMLNNHSDTTNQIIDTTRCIQYYLLSRVYVRDNNIHRFIMTIIALKLYN